MTIRELTLDERSFLAGAVKLLLLSDGVIDDEEIAGVDRLRDAYHFEDMDECLERFEERVEGDEAFDSFAREITRQEARDFIIEELHELSLKGGYQGHEEHGFIERLKRIWSE